MYHFNDDETAEIKSVKAMYQFNDDETVQWCLDEIREISDAKMDKIVDFCKIGEARYMKFYDFIKSLKSIRENQNTDRNDLYSTMLFLTMINDDIDREAWYLQFFRTLKGVGKKALKMLRVI